MTDDFPHRTLVLGLGNPIRGDDGVGWRVVEVLQANLAKALGKPSQGFEFDTVAGGGLNLMERLVGYDRAILVDAMQSGKEPGRVQVFPLEALDNPSVGHLGSTHETNLLTALEIGRRLGAHLPSVGEVMIVAVESQPVFEFSEELSPPVARAVTEAAQQVMNLLKND
jgi:hydrogenase maturation protease